MPNPAKRGAICGFPETIVLLFRELVIFWGFGTIRGNKFRDGGVGWAKEHVSLGDRPELSILKTGVLS